MNLRLPPSLRRGTMFVLALLTAITSLVVVGPSPASAQINRPNVAENEIHAYYEEMLGRTADSGGYTTRINKVYEDCRQGILAAGMIILDSQEAHNRRPNPDSFTVAMYRALLNRDADGGGRHHYVMDVIPQRGYRWAIRDLQSSPEFRGRLAAMCDHRRTSSANVLPAGQAVGAAVGINDAGMTLLVQCGVAQVLELVGPNRIKTIYQATEAIKTAKFILSKSLNKSDSCRAAYNTLTIADHIVRIADYERGNHPTYVGIKQRDYWVPAGHYCDVEMWGGPSGSELMYRKINFRC